MGPFREDADPMNTTTTDGSKYSNNSDSITEESLNAIEEDTEKEVASPVTATTKSKPNANKKRKKQLAYKRCGKGARVKVTRQILYHVLDSDLQRDSLKGFGNNRNFHGTIVGGTSKQG